MDQYTDDERVEDLKKWWKENGASIMGGIVLGLIAIFGWQYWNSHRNTQAEAASRAYDTFIEAVEKPDAEQTRQRGQALLADFPHSAYAALAALRLAKLAADSSDTAAASQRLEWVIGNAQLDELKDIARLRLARISFAGGRIEEAGKLLKSVTTTTLMAERDELQGDLYLAGNDDAKARIAYAAALAASGGGNPLLQLKIDNLAPPTAESIAVAPAEPPATTLVEPAAPVKSATPAVEPATPAVEPATPAVEPATPAVEPATPAVEPAAPVEPATAAVDNETAPAPTSPVPASGQSGQ